MPYRTIVIIAAATVLGMASVTSNALTFRGGGARGGGRFRGNGCGGGGHARPGIFVRPTFHAPGVDGGSTVRKMLRGTRWRGVAGIVEFPLRRGRLTGKRTFSGKSASDSSR
jgi:hypothetical protein